MRLPIPHLPLVCLDGGRGRVVVVTVLAAVIVVGSVLAAAIRVVQVRASATVTGVAPAFAWLGLAANALWLAYGFRMSVLPQVFVSLAWGAMFGYVLWRVAGRQVTWSLAAGAVATVAAGFVLAYGMSGDAAGWAGGLLVLASTAPQAWKTWRTGDVAGTAPGAWVAAGVIGLLWVAYGWVTGLPPVMAVNAVYVLLVVGILAGTVHAGRHRRVGPALVGAGSQS